MFDPNKTFDALGQWPVVQAFFFIVISFLGIMAYRRGDRDRKVEAPLPGLSLLAAVTEIVAQCNLSNKLLYEIIEELRRNRRLPPV